MNKLYYEYLSGNKFSNLFHFKFGIKNKLISRNDIILNAVKNKKVIHLGCVDHDNLIGNPNWIHEKITKEADICLGIDINKSGLEVIKKMGFDNVLYGDITSENLIPEIADKQWDLIVLGDVLEHIDNPVLFLEKIKKNYSGCITNYVITVPNAFNLKNIKNIFKGIEGINSDHRYWFSAYTISKVLTSSGYSIDEICYAINGETHSRGFFSKILLNKYPALRDTIYIKGSL